MKAKEFSAVEVLLVLVIIGATGYLGWYVARSLQNINNAYSSATKTSNSASPRFSAKPADKNLAVLSGTVTEGPTSPVSQAGNSGSAPVANHLIQAENSQNKVIASTKTSAQGKYTLHLPPGNYILVLVPQIGLGTPSNNSVQVASGTNTFNLSVDTGIR